MRAKLIKAGKIVGYTNVPNDTECVVVNDTRGYASDTYLYNESDDAFVYKQSVWIGLNEISNPSQRPTPPRTEITMKIGGTTVSTKRRS